MIIWINFFLNSKLDLMFTAKIFKWLSKNQIQKGGNVLLWNQVKSRIEAFYFELLLAKNFKMIKPLSEHMYWLNLVCF